MAADATGWIQAGCALVAVCLTWGIYVHKNYIGVQKDYQALRESHSALTGRVNVLERVRTDDLEQIRQLVKTQNDILVALQAIKTEMQVTRELREHGLKS